MSRRPFILIALGWLALTFALARDVRAAEWPPREPVERVLANGLRVIVQEDRRLPVVGAHLQYAVGTRSADDGLVILLARLMLRSTAHVRIGEYEQLLAAAGGRYVDWGVGVDATTFSVTVPASHLALPLWLWSDQMGFFAADDEGVRAAYLLSAEDRMRRNESRASGLDDDLSRRELYAAGHPYRNARGVTEAAASKTPDELRQLHARLFTPANATLVLVGDLSASEAFAAVDRYFGSIRRGERATVPNVRRAPPTVVRYELAAHIDDDTLTVDWLLPGTARGDARFGLLAEALGGAHTRMLEWELADGRGLATTATADYFSRELGSIFRVRARVARGHTPRELADALVGYLASISDAAFQASYVARARATLKLDRALTEETMRGRARALARGGALPVATLDGGELARIAREELLPARRLELLWTADARAPLAGVVRSRTEQAP